MNELDRISQTSTGFEGTAAKRLSPRMFNLAVSGIIFLGFCIMGLGTYYTGTMDFAKAMSSTGGSFGFMVLTLVGTVAGIFIMSAGASRQSAAISLVGYALFASTFGLLSSVALVRYDLPTINTAFAATAAITFVFGALGVTFPQVFKRVGGVCCGVLMALLLVEIVLAVMGVNQTITDYIVVIVFAGFIGYDTYTATQVEPTLPNAVMVATNLFMDIINVFLRILDIVGRRD